MALQLQPPYRLVERDPNPIEGTNRLFKPIQGLLQDFFREITHDFVLLSKAYVHKRYGASDPGSGTMNSRYPDEFVDNMVAYWSETASRYVPLETVAPLATALHEKILDRAELYLMSQLLRLS